jgi:hypothetical protein
MHVGGSHKTMREGWPQDARALKQQPAQPPPTSAAGYLPLPVYYYYTPPRVCCFQKKRQWKEGRGKRLRADKVVFFFFYFLFFLMSGKKVGVSILFFKRHFLVIGSRSLPSFYFLSGKFFWFKYRTLVLPYYTHLLRAANNSLLTHSSGVCVCEDTSQKCQEEVGMWETGQLKIDTDWLRK